MLVLTRKVDQGIVIAGNIYIRILGVERDRVKIGIAAPTEIPVLRQELLERDASEPNNNNSAGNRNIASSNRTASKNSEAHPASAPNEG
jgi:carbon storage regulator